MGRPGTGSRYSSWIIMVASVSCKSSSSAGLALALSREPRDGGPREPSLAKL
jgi:hypothetical protein